MAQGGSIVINASVSGIRNPNPGFALYNASKAAVIAMMRTAALEMPAGVSASTLSRRAGDHRHDAGRWVGDIATVAAGLPLKRMGNAEEIAEVAVWLLSEQSSYVVGHVLAADGGFLAA